MKQDYIYKHKKQLTIIGIVCLVVIIIVSVGNIIWNSLHSVTLSLTVAPTIAKVSIDGKNYKPVGEYKIMPGEYEVVVSADGFETKTGKLTAVANETVEISMFLEPLEENIDWYLNHPEDALIVGDIKSDRAAKVLEQLSEENPILKQLPIEIDYYTDNYAKRVKYTISYKLNDDNTGFRFTIADYTGGNYADALSKLTARGVDVDEFEIVYSDESDNLEWGRAK